MVSQDAHFFHDTIRANLKYASPTATDEQLQVALQMAQMWDIVSSLSDGLETVVGDSGYHLSGGEKQRLAIARVLLKSPRIVLMDEPTAHLDPECESALQLALDTALDGHTSLVIAHRLSTIWHADRILMIDGGRIVEEGCHDELVAVDGAYAAFYRTQFRTHGKQRVT
jgi:ATP-binding cassette subfamily B protein